jgi:tetratricopeptide (TPR) repeat protein
MPPAARVTETSFIVPRASYYAPDAVPARFCVRAFARLLLAVALAGGVTTVAQERLPPLPQLAVELFPAPAKEAVARAYEQASARDADVEAVGALAMVLHAWEQWQAAHLAYLRCQALAPRAFEWHYLDGLVLQRLARHVEAAEAFARAASISPDGLPVRIRVADALFDAGELDVSEALYRKLADEPAAGGFGQFGLGRVTAARGRHEAAVVHLEHAIGVYPEWGAAHYAVALSYRAVGRRSDAERALAQHTRHGASWPAFDDPTHARVMALRDDGIARLRRGLQLADAGDLPGAIAAHEAALLLNPSLSQAHANLISLYGRTHEWAAAERHYRETVALGFGLDDAHYNHGVLLGMQDRWAEAAAAYRAAIAVNPQHAQALNNLGQVLERQQQLGAAADAYRQAAASQPLFRLARFNHSRMLLALGRPDAAIGELEKLVEPRDAETPMYLFALGMTHVKSGSPERGLEWIREARRLASVYGQDALVAAIERELSTIR